MLCININVYAQLSERTVAVLPPKTVCQYDTLSNYPKQWCDYVGQDIIFLPVDTTYHALWKDYKCFYSDSLLKTHYICGETPSLKLTIYVEKHR